MMKELIVFGTGGNCIDILDTVNEINGKSKTPIYQCVGFLDDDPQNWEKRIHGIRVLGPLRNASNFNACFFVSGIGSPFNFWGKKEILGKAKMPLERFETIVHPSASVSKMAKLGKGTVVLQNVTIASNVTVGNHVMILPNTLISHDASIGDYSCIAGGSCVSGGVKIGNSCYLGSNCSIIGNIDIGDFSLVGVGSVVINSVNGNSVVVGNPAKFLRETILSRSSLDKNGV
jgi:sugar O-acyltransferase (sialic acid O-acetyltransferase NeuD family)